MTLRSLEVFLAVTETGSMRAAAEKLFISQPSVSGVVADLEREYGVHLFERLGKRLYITPEGKKLSSYARRMLSLNDEIDRQMGSIEDDTPLRIGATVTVGTCLISRLICGLSGAAPYVLVNNTNKIEQQLLANQLDIALVEGTVQSDELLATPVIQDELQLICAATHPLATQKSISLKRLAQERLIMREHGSGTRRTLDELFAAESLPCCIGWECNNTQAILNAVESGLGVAILSPRLLPVGSALVAVPIAGHRTRRSFSLVIHKDKFVTAKLQAFIDLCKAWEP